MNSKGLGVLKPGKDLGHNYVFTPRSSLDGQSDSANLIPARFQGKKRREQDVYPNSLHTEEKSERTLWRAPHREFNIRDEVK